MKISCLKSLFSTWGSVVFTSGKIEFYFLSIIIKFIRNFFSSLLKIFEGNTPAVTDPFIDGACRTTVLNKKKSNML
jgi:hypothetical protein